MESSMMAVLLVDADDLAEGDAVNTLHPLT